MALVKMKPTSPGRRGMVKVVNSDLAGQAGALCLQILLGHLAQGGAVLARWSALGKGRGRGQQDSSGKQ